MKLQLLAAGVGSVIACSSPEKTSPTGTSTPTQSATSVQDGFRPLATLKLNWGDGGPTQEAKLPIPMKHAAGLRIAALQIGLSTPMDVSKAEAKRMRNKVTIPRYIVYIDVVTGNKAGIAGTGSDALAAAHFGIASNDVVGHFDDPNWLPPRHLALLRDRIFSALDVLLPFFADTSRAWTEEAHKAAREVRDFFPLAAEPGLWPYYKAEGKEFFAWVESKAPASKAALPWESK